ncbi:hypothetical protein CP533_0923 [Ophiocordyceps camponoti-saundersi (nom. inval.)]|nr:hypothetical protein CP533_0923 [Ophiocordyceps camponoti-saundersi (nom. inval.)]
MATSMGPNFTGHPAGIPHQAVPGHPMGPGMPPNAAQQGAPGGGMPQQFGGGHMVHNPSAMAAMRQHQLLQHQQQQARQALITQQGIHNMGVGNGLPMGVQISHQHLQQLRNGRLGQVSFSHNVIGLETRRRADRKTSIHRLKPSWLNN